MNDHNKTKLKANYSSEGSSLAIALFFFLLCSLLCAGMLYLANASTHGVSKSLNIAKNQEFTGDPLPDPTGNPTPAPAHDEKYKNDCEAIDIVFNKLNYDYYNAFVTAEGGGQTYIYGADNQDPYWKPQNISYEILSYIHAYIGDTNKVPRNPYGNVEVSFKINLNGYPPIKVTVLLTGFETSNMTNGGKEANHQGLDFETFTLKVESWNHPDCTYSCELKYPNSNENPAQNGKLYVRWSSGTAPKGKYFVIKNTP